MRINRPRSIDFPQLPLQSSESHTHLGRLPVWQHLDSTLIDGSSRRKPKVGCGFGDINGVHFEFVVVLNRGGRPIVDPHSTFGETVLFLELSVHQEKRFAELLGALVQSLFEEISCTFQLGSSISDNKFREIDIPKLKGNGEAEKIDSSFVHLETLLKVFVVLEELSIVDDGLSVGDFELQHPIIDEFRSFYVPTDRFFQVDVK